MIPKFRAFDKSDRIMYDVVMLNWDSTGKVLTDMQLQKGDKSYFSVYPGNMVLMQSTGLRDKTGMEIFEGDILRVRESGNAALLVRTVVERISDEILGDHYGLLLNGICCQFYNSCGGARGAEDCEVIGSIYENPELMEGR